MTIGIRPMVVEAVGMVHCNLCDSESLLSVVRCAKVKELWICFPCAGQIMSAIQTGAIGHDPRDLARLELCR